MTDNSKELPLVKGGQGRSADDLYASATYLSWMLLMVVTCAAIATVVWRCSQ